MKFVITAGHGGNDPGAIGNGFREADLTLELRDLVTDRLQLFGHTVLNDGPKGVNGLFNQALALLGKAPIQIDLHFNAATPLATGTEAISLPTLKPLCQKLSNAVANVLSTRVRGENGWIDQSQSARGTLAYVKKGGIILEVCFITNSNDMNAYNSKKIQVAEAITLVLLTT